MTKFNKLATISMLTGFFVCTYGALAQDDLDALLADLEASTTAPAAPAAEPVAEAAAALPATPAVETVAEPVVAAPEVPAAEPVAIAEAPAVEPVATPEPAVAEVVSEKVEAPSVAAVEEPVAAAAEEPSVAAAEEPVAAAEEPSVVKAEAPAAAEPAPAQPAAESIVDPKNPDAELLQNIVEVERNRRTFMDKQADREVRAARAAMKAADYAEMIRHYYLAQKYINDSAENVSIRKECECGVAEGLYQYAMQENRIGRRERAMKLMDKAIDMRHPKARRQLEAWTREMESKIEKPDFGTVDHRHNNDEYQKMRDEQNRHLRRSRQLLATHELDKALVECEIVLRDDPSNQDALRVRDQIQAKRRVILAQESRIARDGMINDVEEKWRPVYAPNARMLEEVESKTVKTALGDDPERSLEQSIIKRMKDMKLPTVQFKPPATIIDAVDYFRQASKDFDRPDIPLEQRGFNFVLKTPEVLRAQAAAVADDDNGFSDTDSGDGGEQAAQQGVPVIPMITASDISFYEALKLVCDSVEYKFKVQGQIVMVMHKNMSIDEMVTRSYPVLSSFLTKMDAAKDEIKDLQAAGAFGRAKKSADADEENQERDWKEFFRMMGVEWPDGSSIFYMKTLGKLRVKNTRDNLVDFEDALNELNVDQRLIEIESRFVEVCQDDLNSLGFEWLLNSDYSLNLGDKLGKALGIHEGSHFKSTDTSSSSSSSDPLSTSGSGTTASGTSTSSSGDSYTKTHGAEWVRGNSNSKRSVGISEINGTDYSNGNRYLSTVGNHISGEANSTNDRFMKVSAFLGNADLSMVLHMLSQRSDTDLLSAPKVLTRPSEEATIKVVTEYIYPTDYDVQLQSSSSSSSSSSSGSQSAILAVVEPQSFTMREVGVILTVTPTLTDDGNLIDLAIDTKVVDEPTWKNYGMKIPFTGNSSLQNFEGIGGIFDGLANILNTLGTSIDSTLKATIAESATESAITAMDSLSSSDGTMTYYDVPMEQPFFHVRSIESNVSVYPGSTIVMGGLITESRKAMDDKIPFLGDIPIIGRLFRSHSELTSKRNLLIFVTTRLVDTRGREVTQSTGVKEEAEVKKAPESAD